MASDGSRLPVSVQLVFGDNWWVTCVAHSQFLTLPVVGGADGG